MITTDQAKQRISGLTAEQVASLVTRRLLGEDMTPVGSAYAAEPAEDLVIQLLRIQDLAPESRSSILTACRHVYGRLVASLGSPKEADAGRWADVALRLCRVVDATSPDELRGLAKGFLGFATETDCLAPEVRTAAVRAAMGYPQSQQQIPLWEQLLDHRSLAGYAFNALLSIDPHSPRIEGALETLWRKQFLHRWPVDTAFLARRASRAARSTRAIARVLSTFYREGQTSSGGAHLWRQIGAELARRPWTREWLKLVEKLRPSRLISVIGQDDDPTFTFPPATPVIKNTGRLIQAHIYLQTIHVYAHPRDLRTISLVKEFATKLAQDVGVRTVQVYPAG